MPYRFRLVRVVLDSGGFGLVWVVLVRLNVYAVLTLIALFASSFLAPRGTDLSHKFMVDA